MIVYISIAAALAAFTAVVALLSGRVFRSGPPRMLLIALIFTAMLLRVVIMFYLYAEGVDGTGTDGLLYHREARSMQRQLLSGVSLFECEYDFTWYSFFLGILYTVTGTGRWGGSMANILMAALTGLVLARLLRRLGVGVKLTLALTAVWLLFPDLMVWTADTRKEALLYLCVVCALYLLERLRQSEKKTGGVILLCLLTLLCSVVRIYAGYPLALAAVYLWLREAAGKKRKKPLLCALAMGAFLIVMTAVAVYPRLFGYHAVPINDWTQQQDGSLGAEFSSLLKIFLTRNPGMAALSYFLLPLPGRLNMSYIEGIPVAVAAMQIEQGVYYALLVLFIAGTVSALRRKDAYLTALLIFIVFYSLPNILFSEFVSDTILRYRSVILAPMLPFVAEFFRARREAKKLGEQRPVPPCDPDGKLLLLQSRPKLRRRVR